MIIWNTLKLESSTGSVSATVSGTNAAPIWNFNHPINVPTVNITNSIVMPPNITFTNALNVTKPVTFRDTVEFKQPVSIPTGSTLQGPIILPAGSNFAASVTLPAGTTIEGSGLIQFIQKQFYPSLWIEMVTHSGDQDKVTVWNGLGFEIPAQKFEYRIQEPTQAMSHKNAMPIPNNTTVTILDATFSSDAADITEVKINDVSYPLTSVATIDGKLYNYDHVTKNNLSESKSWLDPNTYQYAIQHIIMGWVAQEPITTTTTPYLVMAQNNINVCIGDLRLAGRDAFVQMPKKSITAPATIDTVYVIK